MPYIGNGMENGLANSLVTGSPNSSYKKRYGVGLELPDGAQYYDYSSMPQEKVPVKDESMFSKIGSSLGLGGEGKGGGSTSWTDSVKEWFAPQGTSGASTAGNVLEGLGTAVGIGSGLAGMYYSKKQADLNKERAKMEKDAYNRGVQREAQAEARMQQFAKNAGNGAFYA
jgi:hypothetical protein